MDWQGPHAEPSPSGAWGGFFLWALVGAALALGVLVLSVFMV
jgi:hypothetical protein